MTLHASTLPLKTGSKKSTFFEAINERGLEQLEFLFEKLCVEAAGILPGQYGELGDLVAIDGTFIDAVLSMAWADYRKNSKKAKLHVGFDLNHAIPAKIFLTDGNGHVGLMQKPNRTMLTLYAE